jgi:hypothetical protein
VKDPHGLLVRAEKTEDPVLTALRQEDQGDIAEQETRLANGGVVKFLEGAESLPQLEGDTGAGPEMVIHLSVGIDDDEGIGPVRDMKRLEGDPGAEGAAQIGRTRFLPSAGPDQAPLPLDQFHEQLLSG